jgi:hypothetical protein
MDDDHAEDKDEFNPLIAMMKHLQEIGARHEAQEAESNKISVDNIAVCAQYMIKKKKFNLGDYVTQIDESRHYAYPIPGMPEIVVRKLGYVEQLLDSISSKNDGLPETMVLLIGENKGSPITVRVSPQFFRKMTQKEIENI